MIQKPYGTNDILPGHTEKWQYIESVARETAALYGFGEIRFPTIEYTELFQRGVGDTTDVVQKEMYTFDDREEGRSISLRPEGTASVARSVIENGLYGGTMPLRLYYIINCFRHEKPQAGRYREFYQFGVELFGATSAAADAQIIALGAAFLRRLGLPFILRLNSIGCKKCRADYQRALVEYFSAHRDKLCDSCKTRLERNPLRLLDCKSEICSEIAKDAPKTTDYLCDDCAQHYNELLATLDGMGIEYVSDPKIVRGLDYYSRTVFEYQFTGIGAQNALGGGGRYDGLIESVGGPSLSGIGFAMGINRLILAMEQTGASYPEQPKPTLYIAALGAPAMRRAAVLAQQLREQGVRAESDIVGRSLKAQMKYAGKSGFRYTLMIGDSELETGRAFLRNMEQSEQTEIEIDRVADYLI
ncbi:MAG: histidine--tRNA ligase [Christensenellales bacterium]|nr:MAG: histidine--tRNA ligase [Oscillospiraceae bacterium]